MPEETKPMGRAQDGGEPITLAEIEDAEVSVTAARTLLAEARRKHEEDRLALVATWALHEQQEAFLEEKEAENALAAEKLAELRRQTGYSA